jgi:hypothetical protein
LGICSEDNLFIDIGIEFMSKYSGLANMYFLEYWLAAWVPPIGLDLAIRLLSIHGFDHCDS